MTEKDWQLTVGCEAWQEVKAGTEEEMTNLFGEYIDNPPFQGLHQANFAYLEDGTGDTQDSWCR